MESLEIPLNGEVAGDTRVRHPSLKLSDLTHHGV
jgi:hypothetical protein